MLCIIVIPPVRACMRDTECVHLCEVQADMTIQARLLTLQILGILSFDSHVIVITF